MFWLPAKRQYIPQRIDACTFELCKGRCKLFTSDTRLTRPG